MTEHDGEIRDAFLRAASADPSVDPSGVADAVRQAAMSTPPSGPPGRGFTKLVGGIGAAGVIIGGGLGLTGAFHDDEAASRLARLDRVAAAACPGGPQVLAFHRGDGVLATARSQDGAFIEVRSPRDPAERVWVAAPFVDSESDVSQLPVGGCEDAGLLTLGDEAAASPGTEPATTSTEAGVATTVPTVVPTTITGSPTTTRPTTTVKPVTPATTAPSPAPTTSGVPPSTTVGDTTAPTIGSIGSNPNTIAAFTYCAPPWTTSVSASVTDAVAVTSVTVSWVVAGVPRLDESGVSSKAMTKQGNTYSASIGRFPGPNVTLNSSLTITLTARDAAGNQSTRATSITLRDCYFG